MENNKIKPGLGIASTLCWVLGVINLLGGIAIGIPMVATGNSVVYPVAIFLVGAGLCFSGHGLRKTKRSAGVTAILFSLLSFVSPPLIGLILGLTIIIMTVINWKELK